MQKKKNLNVKKIEQICSLCGRVFYATKKTAHFCSDSCKQVSYQLRLENKDGYLGDLNSGAKLSPGTITSQGMPETSFVFSGSFSELEKYLLENYITNEHLNSEMQYLLNLKPICDVHDWNVSSCQIFSNTHLLEVVMINPRRYKLYAYKWQSDDEKPFNIL